MAPTFTAFGFIEFRSHHRDVGKKNDGKVLHGMSMWGICACVWIKVVKQTS